MDHSWTILPTIIPTVYRSTNSSLEKIEGARASRTFLAPSRPRYLMRRGRMGHRVTHLRPASGRGLQGGFGMGRVEVPPHPPATRGSRVLQDRVWGSRVL